MVGATSMLETRFTVPRSICGPAAMKVALIDGKARVMPMRAVEVRRREHRRQRIEGRIAEPGDAGILDAVEIVAFVEHREDVAEILADQVAGAEADALPGRGTAASRRS